jgi:hypothetical protein
MRFGGSGNPSYIVIHTISGTIDTADARFKSSQSQASAHYGIGLDGRLVQWLNESNTGYHSGNWDINLRSIAIEHDDGGNPDGPRTDALYAASGGLVRDICLRYGIPISPPWIIKHSDVPGVATICPGALDVDRILTVASAGAYRADEPALAEAAAVSAAPVGSRTAADLTATAAAGSAKQPAGASANRDTAAPAQASPSPGKPPGPPDALRDIASGIYGDPHRRLDIYNAIKTVVHDLSAAGDPGRTDSSSTEIPSADGPTDPGATTRPNAATSAYQGSSSATGKVWGGSQGTVFGVQVIYLTILAALAIAYFSDRSLIGLPDSLGPISLAVPWFGALGAVLISVVGLTQHRHDWDPTYRFWHWSRPLLGASFGSISVLVFQAGILAVGSTPTAPPQNIPRNLLYYVIAFVVGYREETFRELIKRLTDIIFSPGPTPGAGLAISSMAPQSGPAAGGTVVTVLGTGLTDTDSVRFGVTPGGFKIAGDSQVTVTSPAGQAGTSVNVVVATKSSAVAAGSFAYT